MSLDLLGLDIYLGFSKASKFTLRILTKPFQSLSLQINVLLNIKTNWKNKALPIVTDEDPQ